MPDAVGLIISEAVVLILARASLFLESDNTRSEEELRMIRERNLGKD